jgi:4-hydroxy-3-methylbut-2-enyl diphosphate reductase
VPRGIVEEARARNLFTLDATCPLVTKVHREAELHHRRGRRVLLVGHRGHPEVEGTMGQLPDGAVILVETPQDIDALEFEGGTLLAYVTQTTLSVADTAVMVERLEARFPGIAAPHKADICYATTNRQEAVARVAPLVDAMIVVGSPNSSNSQRLREVAIRAGCPLARLVLNGREIDWTEFGAISRLGITAGASAPESLVEDVIAAFDARFAITLETVSTAEETMFFPLPRALRETTPLVDETVQGRGE